MSTLQVGASIGITVSQCRQDAVNMQGIECAYHPVKRIVSSMRLRAAAARALRFACGSARMWVIAATIAATSRGETITPVSPTMRRKIADIRCHHGDTAGHRFGNSVWKPFAENRSRKQ